MTDRRDRSLVARVAPIWLAWFLVYLGTGALAMMQNRTAFFAQTVEHISWPWVQWTILNIPLQLVLAGTAIVLAGSSIAAPRKVGNVIAVITTGLIAAHVVTSVAVGVA